MKGIHLILLVIIVLGTSGCASTGKKGEETLHSKILVQDSNNLFNKFPITIKANKNYKGSLDTVALVVQPHQKRLKFKDLEFKNSVIRSGEYLGVRFENLRVNSKKTLVVFYGELDHQGYSRKYIIMELIDYQEFKRSFNKNIIWKGLFIGENSPKKDLEYRYLIISAMRSLLKSKNKDAKVVTLKDLSIFSNLAGGALQIKENKEENKIRRFYGREGGQ